MFSQGWLSALLAGAPGHLVLQRYELFGALTKVAAFAAASSRWCYTTTPLPAKALPRHPCQQQPHPAEKRTPVWLAIWRTWAGFANSQLRHAPFLSLYLYMCLSALLPPWSRCSDRRKSIGPSAPIAYATSVSPPDEAVAWPRCSGVGCWMRLLPGKGAGDGWQIMLLVVRVAVPANHRAL